MKEAAANLAAMAANPYPGRIIGVGTDQTGKFYAQFAVLMGRSDDSRNRIYKASGGRVYTALADPARPAKDPKITLYNAMREHSGCYVVSNGHPTDDILDYCSRGRSMTEALQGWTYEPEEADFTPRISGICRLGGPSHFELNILRRSKDKGYPDDGREPLTLAWDVQEPGTAMGLRTHETNGTPLPAYRGNPYPLPIVGNADEAASVFWENLDKENRVAIAMKYIEISTGQSRVAIINRHN